MKRLYKKYDMKQTKFNDSKIRRAYYFYLHQTIFDQLLDILVFFAISFTIVEVIGQFFFTLPGGLIHILHSFSVLILTIFGLELLREYALSEHRYDFYKKHWIDFSLVVFMSIYFFGATYFGLAKLTELTRLNKIAKETKHFKIVLRALKIVK